jgi:hypothetical protein
VWPDAICAADSAECEGAGRATSDLTDVSWPRWRREKDALDGYHPNERIAYAIVGPGRMESTTVSVDSSNSSLIGLMETMNRVVHYS